MEGERSFGLHRMAFRMDLRIRWMGESDVRCIFSMNNDKCYFFSFFKTSLLYMSFISFVKALTMFAIDCFHGVTPDFTISSSSSRLGLDCNISIFNLSK